MCYWEREQNALFKKKEKVNQRAVIRRYLREDEQLEILIISVRRCAITSCYVINLFFFPLAPKEEMRKQKNKM